MAPRLAVLAATLAALAAVPGTAGSGRGTPVSVWVSGAQRRAQPLALAPANVTACALTTLGLLSAGHGGCAGEGLPTWSATGGSHGGLTVLLAAVGASNTAGARSTVFHRGERWPEAHAAAPALGRLGWAAAAALQTAAAGATTTHCEALGPALPGGLWAQALPLLACVADSGEGAAAAVAAATGGAPAVAVVVLTDGVSAVDVADATAGDTQVVGLALPKLALAPTVLNGGRPVAAAGGERRRLASGALLGACVNGSGNCTTPWTGAEIDEYQVAVWTAAVLAALLLGTVYALAGSLEGATDPLLTSAFQAGDFHAHRD